MSNHPTSKDLPSVISSPVSEDGAEHLSLQDGAQSDLFGQDRHRASLFQQPGTTQEKRMTDIFGLSFSISSASAALQQSLESRLQAQLDLDGSTIYKLTWKQKVTPQRRSYYHLAASALRTKENGCSSWPTPTAATGGASKNPNNKRGINGGNPMATAAAMVPWPTPSVRDYKDTGNLDKSRFRKSGKERHDTVPRVAFGTAPPLSTAETANTVPSQLNHRFSLWLMGYPIEWAYCAERVTPLSRKRQPKL